MTTAAATAVTSTGATLNGSANPNGAATTGWFRYGTTNPGTCNDTFGTRAPAAAAARCSARAPRAVAYSQTLVGPDARDDLLLLRHRLERRGHALRRGAVVHHAGGADA